MAESTEKKTVAERAADLSDEVLERVEARQRAAIEALRKFVDRLDDAMPNLVDDPSAAQEGHRRHRGLLRAARHDDERVRGHDGAQRDRDAERARRKDSSCARRKESSCARRKESSCARRKESSCARRKESRLISRCRPSSWGRCRGWRGWRRCAATTERPGRGTRCRG